MYQIDDATAVATLPTPAAAGTPGYFTDGNPTALPPVQPTIVPADFFNALMLELLNLLAAAGITPSKTAYNQVVSAIEELIEARSGNYAVDTGVANAYVIALSPPVSSYTEGLSVRFRATNPNTGASTLNAGAGAVPLLNGNSTPLTAGEIAYGSIVSASYDTTAAGFLISSITAPQSITTVVTDTSAGPASYALPAPSAGTTGILFIDRPGTWAINPLTLIGSGATVMGSATFALDTVGAQQVFVSLVNSDWKVS